jgi:hypothetical protein
MGSPRHPALLPHISYRRFAPDRRDAALAWVETGADPEG